MSEPLKLPRAGSAAYETQARSAYGSRGQDDPLAELARLVGKDDPFRRAPVARLPQGGSFGTGAATASTSRPIAQPEAYPAYGNPVADRTEPGFADFDAQLRGSLDQRASEPQRPRDALRFPALPAPEPHHSPVDHPFDAPIDEADAAPLQADLWAEGMMAQAPDETLPFDEHLQVPDRPPVRSPRRTLAVLAAVLALTAGGIGATFLMHGNSSALTRSSDAPTILASGEPVKVQAPDTSNGGGPEASTALLEKSGSDNVEKAKVVNTQERPVDLAQLPKAAGSQADDVAAQAGVGPSPFPEPRKVKTILIRPDGSVVGETAAPAADVATALPPGGVVMPAAVDPMATATTTSDTTLPPPSPAPTAKPSVPKSTARVSSTPKGPEASASGAKQANAPVRTPKPKPVVTADATPAPAVTPGTYAVQLAAPGTEQDAKDVSSRLQKKFAGELGGMKPTIHKGESGTKSVYRVRVSNLSQDDAKSLCTKLQAGGGTCFVVRN